MTGVQLLDDEGGISDQVYNTPYVCLHLNSTLQM